MRRRAGVAAVQKRRVEESRYRDKGSALAQTEMASLAENVAELKQRLESFAVDHKEEIRRDAQFRRHFQEMCATIGVDPLASSKGFWNQMLGFGDFYYELAIQIVEMCMATSHVNGGIMHCQELKRRLAKSRSHRDQVAISEDDLVRAIGKLKVLGNGFTIIHLESEGFLVQSIPLELSLDNTALLQMADASNGKLTFSAIRTKMRWDDVRIQRALDQLIKNELAWIDEQAEELQYWIISLFKTQSLQALQ